LRRDPVVSDPRVKLGKKGEMERGAEMVTPERGGEVKE